MYKKNLALNSTQWLIYHKTKADPSKPKHKMYQGRSMLY